MAVLRSLPRFARLRLWNPALPGRVVMIFLLSRRFLL
jgi:hypothetical protein